MPELSVLLLGGFVGLISQISKKFYTDINPLFLVAFFSLIAGFIYVVFVQQELITQAMIEKSVEAFATSVVIFNVLKQFVKK